VYEDLCLYIDGEFIKGGDRPIQDVFDPSTGDVIATLPHATRADLDRALAAAQRAFASWKGVSPLEKSRVLRKVGELTRERAKAIGTNITLDQGKPLAESVSEVTRCADHCDWHAEECRRIYGRVIPPRLPNVRQLRRCRVHDHPQGARGRAERGRRDRAHVPRSRPPSRRAEYRVGRPE
jgi:succinate-semialdehyde dehydrogenase / glutarate-semialdehyde dehydrogenase